MCNRQVVGIGDVDARHVLVDESPEGLHSLVIVPLRVGWILVMVPTITPVDLSRPAGFSVAPTELDGYSKDGRLPANFGSFADGLRGEFWCPGDQ